MANILVFETLKASAVTTAAETVVGAELNVKSADKITLWVKYTKGDETSVAIVPKFLHTTGGDEYALGSWDAAAGAKTFTADSLVVSATGNYYVTLDIASLSYIKFYEDATDGTPTGTTAIAYALVDEK